MRFLPVCFKLLTHFAPTAPLARSSRDEAQRNRGRSSSFSQRPGIRFAASRLQTDGTTVFRVEDENVVTLAIDACRAGLDFADALTTLPLTGANGFRHLMIVVLRGPPDARS